MQTDVGNKVRNVKLGRSRCLQPLSEAIMNSIHAIHETNPDGGRVDVFVIRDASQQLLVEPDATNYPSTGFTVRDNGVGFSDHHFESFDHGNRTFKRLEMLCESRQEQPSTLRTICWGDR